jgi:hypothetical protein
MKAEFIEVAGYGRADVNALTMRTTEEKSALRLMSRSGLLAYHATRAAVTNAAWSDGELQSVGLFVGVGASGSDLGQLQKILLASSVENQFSATRFGEQGLRACNPLFAFALMNNFVMANTAMLLGTQSANAVLFSRGTGTALALEQAVAALRDGDCRRCLVGGADEATHAVTALENLQAMMADQDCKNSDDAAVFALEAVPAVTGRWRVDSVNVCERKPDTNVNAMSLGIRPGDDVFVDGWSPATVREMSCIVSAGEHGASFSLRFGELRNRLAAGPSVSWIEGLRSSSARSLSVLHLDIDDRICAVRFVRGDA